MNVEQTAKEDAQKAIEIARNSDEPVAFITGNNYFPALRGFERGEEVWQTDDVMNWEHYVETFERTLEDADVLLNAPDYDNALYVVDLKRWEYNEFLGDDAETLNEEWRKK